MAETNATFFYMTDTRGTDRTKAVEPASPGSTSSSSDVRYKLTSKTC